jgi:hypothetical protein
MKQTQHRFIFSLMTMAVLVYAAGCSTVTPPPERVAAAKTQAWDSGAPPSPTQHDTNGDLFLLARLIADLVGMAVK